MNQHPNYELFEELGRGENTVVYRAYDLSLGREVAIKELDESGRRDPRRRERFLREAQFLAQFEHDNVLRVYSVDTERGWIVMELMKGTLESVIASGPSDPDLVRSVLKQTLEALAFLHEKNKVHGAVRPSNLLINDAGRVKLSEFEQTDAGGEVRVPTGSKKYLAPELIRPDFGDFGPPLDLYCLGFAALELLKGAQFEGLFPGTGKGAIDADTAWLRWHSSPNDLEFVRKLVKNIPDDLAQVLDHMLKKRVADRPQSAQKVLEELADRPLVPVPVAGVSDDAEPSATSAPGLSPAVVKVLAAPQNVLPRGSSPAVTSGAAATKDRPAEKTGRAAKHPNNPAAPKYSKDWFNQQLSQPLVLYPLCGLILLGALWMSIRLNSGGTPDPAATLVAVTFDVEPDAQTLEVVEADKPVAPAEDGKYGFQLGRHSVTLRKEGFHPITRELDVSQENHTFAVKFEPVIKFVDVVVELKPADATLQVGGESKAVEKGVYTHKLKEGDALQVAASLDGYVSASRTVSAEELAKLGNKLTIELEKEKPRLPASLIAKPGAALDSELQLPERVLATALGDSEPLELVLVKPGTYSFGNADDNRQASELSARKVIIETPFYIAVNETTNAQYEKFFESAGEKRAGARWQKASRKWAEPLALDPVKNRLPVTNVSPEQATAFCEWLGGRLPTEIEWESAVRGPKDKGFPFPWSNDEPSRSRCQIFYGELGPVLVEKLSGGANSVGLLHTIGNAAEWCHDSEQSGTFILRGCSFATANIDHVRVTWRARGDAHGEEDTGFRVVVPLADEGPATLVESADSASSADNRVPAPLKVLSTLPWKTVSGTLGLGR